MKEAATRLTFSVAIREQEELMTRELTRGDLEQLAHALRCAIGDVNSTRENVEKLAHAATKDLGAMWSALCRVMEQVERLALGGQLDEAVAGILQRDRELYLRLPAASRCALADLEGALQREDLGDEGPHFEAATKTVQELRDILSTIPGDEPAEKPSKEKR